MAIKSKDNVRVPSSNMPEVVGKVVTTNAFWTTILLPSGFTGTYQTWQVVKVVEK